jgi:NAD(P)H-dependent FMN reductase
MPILMMIIASTRPERVGPSVAKWFAERARRHGTFDLDVVDLAELELPFLDEPKHPRLRDYTHDHTREWSERVDAADAFVFVTSEYNYGYPAPLKNAIDYLHHEWRYKPVGFVSYGGVAAGTRAMLQLKQVMGALRAVPVVEAVNIPFVAQLVDDDGALHANDVTEQAVPAMLDELARVEQALRSLRAKVTMAS